MTEGQADIKVKVNRFSNEYFCRIRFGRESRKAYRCVNFNYENGFLARESLRLKDEGAIVQT